MEWARDTRQPSWEGDVAAAFGRGVRGLGEGEAEAIMLQNPSSLSASAAGLFGPSYKP